MSLWNNPGRKYFPDEQVHPDEILRVLREHRADAPDQPWLTSIDVGWRVGAIRVCSEDRWLLHDAIESWDMERRWRRLPYGYRWRHRVGQRDVSTGLVSLEAEGIITRLPRFARGWAYWVATYGAEDEAQFIAHFADMAQRRAELQLARSMVTIGRTRKAYGLSEGDDG